MEYSTIPAYILKLPIPKTQKLSFELVFKGLDKNTLETFQNISAIREDARLTLDSEVVQGSINAIDKYMPHFLGLMEASESLPAEFAKNLRIIWNTPICIRNMNSSFVYAGFRFEVVMCLLSYGILHRNLARDMLQSTSFDSTDFDEKSKVIASLLTKAAGIFEHISQSELSKWKPKPDTPLPEAMDETYLALSNLCIAEAQEITVKKGLLKGTSGAALSKLCTDIYQRYEHSYSILKGMSGNEQVNLTLLNYLTINGILWKAISYRLLAVDNYNKGNYGAAVAYAEKAASFLTDRKDKDLDGFINQYNAEKETIRMLAKKYREENDTIYFESIPSQVEPPEAKCLMKVTPFVPPHTHHIQIVQQKGADCVIQ